jgi:methionyl-tRNA synthetase
LLAKDNKKEHVNNFLYCLGNAVRIITCLLQPILVQGTKTIIEQLHLTQEQLNFDHLNNFDLLNEHKVGNSTPIYNRINKAN